DLDVVVGENEESPPRRLRAAVAVSGVEERLLRVCDNEPHRLELREVPEVIQGTVCRAAIDKNEFDGLRSPGTAQALNANPGEGQVVLRQHDDGELRGNSDWRRSARHVIRRVARASRVATADARLQPRRAAHRAAAA